MRYYYLEKSDLGKFIEHLKKDRRVVAPVKKENQFIFAEIDSVDEITPDRHGSPIRDGLVGY